MVNKKLVSIIVPVYNGERHIRKCIENLLKQTFYSIEIIVINDGSEDNTGQILDNIRKDSRVKVIHKKNQGVSVARNTGILAAKGDYILFVDSDDHLDYQAVEKLLYQTCAESVDLILFGFNVIGSACRLNDTNKLKEIGETTDKDIKDHVIKSIISTKDNIYGYIWRAMYSRSMLMNNNILFPEGIKISEDYMFLLNAVVSSNKILIDCSEYYNYIINESSMSIKYIPTLLHDMVFVNEWMHDNIIIKNENLREGYCCSVCNTYLRYVQNTVRNTEITFFEKVKEIRNNKRKYDFQSIINKVWCKHKNFNLKSEIGIVLFRFNLDFLYIILFEIKEKRNRLLK